MDTAPRHEITLNDEEISDVNLATFCVFDKENAGAPRLGEKLAWGCRGCRGCGGCYGSKPDWSAFGGHGASLGDVEVVVRFRGRLVLDVVNPHFIGMAATLVRFHPANLHRSAAIPSA